MVISDSSWFTGGLYLGSQTTSGSVQWSPLVTGGVPALIGPSQPAPNQFEQPQTLNSPQISSLFTSTQLSDLAALNDINGMTVVPSANSYVDMGSGQSLTFDPSSLRARISPGQFSDGSPSVLSELDGSATYTYSGSDIRIIIEIPTPSLGASGKRYAKQLVECTTMTVSIHRSRTQVRACSFINPKGFADGTRTVAGTLILTQFMSDVLMNFLNSGRTTDTSKDTQYNKVDQLPMFNMMLLFSNEYGYASYRQLIGVKFVTDGTTYSVQDMMTEQTISYLAMDFTPLTPLDLSSLFQVTDPTDRMSINEQTPADLMTQA